MSGLPYISVVVPTHRRPRQLAACLDALASLDYPRERFEVVVVDDGGAGAEEAVAPFRERVAVTAVAQRHAGPAAARNTGAARARGEFLAFTDDDCAPAPDWLRRLAARLAEAPRRLVGGHTVNALEENLCSSASQMLIDYLYEYYNAVPGRAVFFTSNNMALAAEGFRRVGGFDASFPLAAGEDREFCDRWRRAGLGMTYAPEAVVRHAHHLTPRSFWRQHFNYGRSAFHFHRARARAGGRVEVEPARFYADLLLYPARRERGWRGAAVAALFGVSQAANAAGFFAERARTKGGGK